MVQHRDFFTVSGVLLRSRLAFNADDSSYVFKILIGKVLVISLCSEKKQGSPSDIITFKETNRHLKIASYHHTRREPPSPSPPETPASARPQHESARQLGHWATASRDGGARCVSPAAELDHYCNCQYTTHYKLYHAWL